MIEGIDRLRVRAALDTAVQNSFARYFRMTERAREDFKRADEQIWRKYYPWYRTARDGEARAQVLASYERELSPWAQSYENAMATAELTRKREKQAIEAALQTTTDSEEQIRQLSII